jgi:hypothetical protein
MTMSYVRTRLGSAGLVVCTLAVGCGPGSHAMPVAHPRSVGQDHTATRLDRTVILNDGDRLDPPPVDATARLTAREAWRAYAVRNHARKNRERLPAGAHVYLAVFTTSGDIKDRLVYGVRIPGCHPIYPLAPPTPYPSGCVGWEILDANTSADLDLAWEGLPGEGAQPTPSDTQVPPASIYPCDPDRGTAPCLSTGSPRPSPTSHRLVSTSAGYRPIGLRGADKSGAWGGAGRHGGCAVSRRGFG